jgi:hypothetical protein
MSSSTVFSMRAQEHDHVYDINEDCLPIYVYQQHGDDLLKDVQAIINHTWVRHWDAPYANRMAISWVLKKMDSEELGCGISTSMQRADSLVMVDIVWTGYCIFTLGTHRFKLKFDQVLAWQVPELSEDAFYAKLSELQKAEDEDDHDNRALYVTSR